MKISYHSCLITLFGAFALATTSAQPFDSAEDLQNRAVASSPRARELFPFLTRKAAPQLTGGTARATTPGSAFAASPRVLEAHPELTRTAVRKTYQKPSDVIQNTAIASSPRFKEEFPWLARQQQAQDKSIQVAPLK